MEGVALPMKCGLGGDLVALFRRAGGPFEAIVSVGPGARALADGEKLERLGPRSVGIPGAPDGYATLHRFGRLGLDTLTAPAIAAAETGVPWSRVALNYYIQAEELLARWSPNSAYAPDGKRPVLGSLRRLPGLGALLRDFVKDGADLFAGAAGDLYLKELQAKGGILTSADLATRPARLLDADMNHVFAPAEQREEDRDDERAKQEAAFENHYARSDLTENRPYGRTSSMTMTNAKPIAST